MSDWIADRAYWPRRWEPWRTDPKFVLQDGNSVHHQWINLASGARMLLIADGSWSEPERARFRLWARYIGSDADVELTPLLENAALNGGHYLTDQPRGSAAYQVVEVSCVETIEQWLGIPDAQRTILYSAS